MILRHFYLACYALNDFLRFTFIAAKFFKSGERNKQRLSEGKTQKENNDKSWVDLDAVFGFGMED